MVAKATNIPGDVVLDFTGVKPFEPLDEKVVYLVGVDSITPAISGETQKPMDKVVFTIKGPAEVQAMGTKEEDGEVTLTGDYAGHTTKAAGRKLFRNYMLQENAMPFLYEFIKGVDPSADLNTKTFQFKPAAYIGLEAACRIKNRVYNGQVQSDVARILPASAYKE